MFNFPNKEYFCKVSCPQIGFLCHCGDKEGGQDIYNDGGDGKKKMTTPMLLMLIRKWRVWNLTKGSIRVMEWASAQSADGYWTNTILSDFEWISSDQLS